MEENLETDGLYYKFSYQTSDLKQVLYEQNYKDICGFIVMQLFLIGIFFNFNALSVKISTLILFIIISLLGLHSIYSIKRFVRKNPQIFGEIEINFTENEINVASMDSKVTIFWKGIKKIIETDNFFYFYTFVDGKNGIIFPKKVFTQEKELQKLRNFLNKHIKIEKTKVKLLLWKV